MTYPETTQPRQPLFFETRPVTVQAMRWDGTDAARAALLAFTRGNFSTPTHPTDPTAPAHTAAVFDHMHEIWIPIQTGDWVIRGTEGEYYPIKDEVLRKKYTQIPTPTQTPTPTP